MPIYGLSDQAATIKEIGRIRKGGPKTEYKPGPNLDYFRVTFRDDELEAQKTFVDVYGEHPVFINLRLAFDTIPENWFAWYTCYLKGGQLGMADGKKWHYLRDYRSQKVLIKNGELTNLGVEAGISLDFNKEDAVYFYYSRKQKKDMPVYARPEGRLSVMIPELGRFVSMTLLTHSLHDIGHIEGALKFIESRSKLLGVPMSFIPLTLSRQTEQISKPMDNGRGMVDEWLVKLEIHPDFAGMAIPYLTRQTVARLQSLPEPADRPDLLTLPEPELDGDEPTEEDMEPEDEIKPGPQFEAQPDAIVVTEPDPKAPQPELIPIKEQDYWKLVYGQLKWSAEEAQSVLKQYDGDFVKAFNAAKKQMPD